MAKRKVNVALVGAQFMGKAHSNAWQRVKMFFDTPVEPVLKVMCGKFKEELATAERWGWQETSLDWEEVVNRDDIDIVDICTPNALHPCVALAAARTGKHVICEKPLANSLKAASDMVSAVKRAGVKNMCGFSYRFAPAVVSIKNMIESGQLGQIFHFRAAYQQDWIVDPDFPMVWRLRKKHAGSGALGDIGAHIVDLCHYLIGPVSEVCGTTTTFIKKRPVTDSDIGIEKRPNARMLEKMGTVDVDDAAAFIAHIKKSHTLATFEATRFAPGRRNYNAIEIYGSEGSVLWNQENMNVFRYFNRNDPANAQGFRDVKATDPGHPYAHQWWPAGHIIGYEHLFVHEIYEFLNSLETPDTPYPTFEDAVRGHRVLAAVLRSSASKKWEMVR